MISLLLLLAEDESLIAMSAQDALEAGGFSVITAASGSEAMALIEDRYEELAGLVTDVRLGDGPDGWELATRARELKSDVAVVYTTGDSAHEWSAHGVPNSSVIQKPYASAQLVTAISMLLTQSDTSRA
jgi:DNA-binding response OmpR family regulator